MIDALNLWTQASEESLTVVKSVIDLLHNASLM